MKIKMKMQGCGWFFILLVIALLVSSVWAGAEDHDGSLMVFDDGLNFGFSISRGDLYECGSGNIALHREYAPASGTWDALNLSAAKPLSLDGRTWLKTRVNFVPSSDLPKSLIRRISVRTMGSGGAKTIVWEPADSKFYLDGQEVTGAASGLLFDTDPNTWQLLELNLEDGRKVASDARIDRFSVIVNAPGDLYLDDIVFTELPNEYKQKRARISETRGDYDGTWPWVSENRYRLMVQCQDIPQGSARCPAWTELDMDSLVRYGEIEGPLNPDSLRVVEYNPRSGSVIRQPETGLSDNRFVPAKVDRWRLLPGDRGKTEVRRPEQVSWLRRADGPEDAVYAVYFDAYGCGETNVIPVPSFVGTGDPLAHAQTDAATDVQGVVIPMDYNGDGVKDLVTSIRTVPQFGMFVFANEGSTSAPVFGDLQQIGPEPLGSFFCLKDIDGDEQTDLGVTGGYYTNIEKNGFDSFCPVTEPEAFRFHRVLPKARSYHWYYSDWDGDGITDLLVGCDCWGEYGWCNAYDRDGNWLRGGLDGRVYWFRNLGDNTHFELDYPVRLKDRSGAFLRTSGHFSPVAEDFDNDGDLDMLSGDFLDQLYFFENTGTRTAPVLELSRPVMTTEGAFRSEYQLLTPTVTDWDDDGDLDIFIRTEDGRSGYLENLLADRGELIFKPVVNWQCRAEHLFAPQLVVQNFDDWDGDGLEDLVFGHSPGFLGWFRNTGTAGNWAFGQPEFFSADGERIRVVAGKNGSLQGPAEALWGYTVPEVVDWDLDGLPDIICNTIWGRIIWFKNLGMANKSVLDPAQNVDVQWDGPAPKPAWRWWDPKPNEWSTQWRSKVQSLDYDNDGLKDLIALDYEGYLVLHRRVRENGELKLGPAERIFGDAGGQPWQINSRRPGNCGRTKFDMADWDGDGDLDLIQHADNSNVKYFENIGGAESPRYMDRGALVDVVLTGHDCTPTILDYDQDGKLDLIIGAEDGHFYCFNRVYIEHKEQLFAVPLKRK